MLKRRQKQPNIGQGPVMLQSDRSNLAPGGGKKRDPGNEVGIGATHCIALAFAKSLKKLAKKVIIIPSPTSQFRDFTQQ